MIIARRLYASMRSTIGYFFFSLDLDLECDLSLTLSCSLSSSFLPTTTDFLISLPIYLYSYNVYTL